MTDYIKRDDAIEALNRHKKTFSCGEDNSKERYAYMQHLADYMAIENVPSADVVEIEKVNKIYEKLVDLFDIPCNYSPCDEIMLESGRCREDCGNISNAECWKRYFEVVCNGERSEA